MQAGIDVASVTMLIPQRRAHPPGNGDARLAWRSVRGKMRYVSEFVSDRYHLRTDAAKERYDRIFSKELFRKKFFR